MLIDKNVLKITSAIALVIFNTVVTFGSVTAVPDTTFNDIGVTFAIPKVFTFKDNYWAKDRIEFHFECRINNVRPNILPRFYLMNQDSSVLILVEDYRIYKNTFDPLSSYAYDEHSPIFYDVSTYSTNVLPTFLPVQELEQSNADRVCQFVHKCKLVNSEYTQVISQQYLKFNQGYLKIYYLAKSHVDNLEKIIENNSNFIRFDDDSTKYIDLGDIKDYYAHIEDKLIQNVLPLAWNKGKLYNQLWYFTGEKYAFKMNSVIISLQFPSNKTWPYFNSLSFKEQFAANKDKWEKANKDFTKYLVNSKGEYKELSKGELQKLNADEGYLFDFSHTPSDLYRNEYQDCKVLLIHKKNVGSIIVKYYYMSGDHKTVNKIIKSTWGKISFKNKSYFNNMEGKVYPY